MSNFDAELAKEPQAVQQAIVAICERAGTYEAAWPILAEAGRMVVGSRSTGVVSEEVIAQEAAIHEDLARHWCLRWREQDGPAKAFASMMIDEHQAVRNALNELLPDRHPNHD